MLESWRPVSSPAVSLQEQGAAVRRRGLPPRSLPSMRLLHEEKGFLDRRDSPPSLQLGRAAWFTLFPLCGARARPTGNTKTYPRDDCMTFGKLYIFSASATLVTEGNILVQAYLENEMNVLCEL